MKKLLFILALLVLPVPAAAADPSPTPAAVPLPSGGDVWINELLPNPEGADSGNEWIELKNVSGELLDIGGLKVKRQSGTSLGTVPEGTALPPGGLFLLTVSGSMVNGGDTLELWSDSVLVDQVTYDIAEDGMSWVRLGVTEGAWSNAPTPGEENPADVSTDDPSGGDDGGSIGATEPTAASTRAAAGNTTVPRTAAAKAKRSPLPKSGVGAWTYALPALLATLYAYKTRHDY